MSLTRLLRPWVTALPLGPVYCPLWFAMPRSPLPFRWVTDRDSASKPRTVNAILSFGFCSLTILPLWSHSALIGLGFGCVVQTGRLGPGPASWTCASPAFGRSAGLVPQVRVLRSARSCVPCVCASLTMIVRSDKRGPTEATSTPGAAASCRGALSSTGRSPRGFLPEFSGTVGGHFTRARSVAPSAIMRRPLSSLLLL